MKQFIFFSLLFTIFIFLLMYLWQRHLIYFPVRQKPELKDFHAEDMKIVTLATKDGLQLTSWYKPAQSSQPTIVYFHGNAGHIGYRMPLARQFLQEGYGVFLLEYRGYGGNEGKPAEKGLYEDARAAMEYLLSQGLTSRQLALFGESLGTAVATRMGVEYSVCAIVLQSPFTSLADLARYHYPWTILKPWDHYNSLQRIEKINAPILILHGEQDSIVPVYQAKKLYVASKEPKKFKLFEDRGHNNLWSAPFYVETITRFISTHCH